MFTHEIIEMVIGMVGIIGIICVSTSIPFRYYYSKKKLEEEHRTNNLALAYQILDKRPEVSLDDVKELIQLSGGELSNAKEQKRISSR